MVKSNKKIWLSISLGLLLTVSLAMPAFAGSASLYLSPPSGTYTVGSTFSVRINVNSGGEAINAAEGTLIFNPAELQVISLSKSNSVFTLWTTEPTFSNSAGNIVFGGGNQNPFTGTAGTIITITFKARASASAQVNFSSGSVLANDGKGTNILASFGNAKFSLSATAPSTPEAITPPVITGVPSAPKISSSTHPDSDKWYNNPNAKFSWSLSDDITSIKFIYDKFPSSQPKVVYTPPIAEKELNNLEDGIYYFHVQSENKYGWGKISHFRFQIDTRPPEPFTIKFTDGKKTDNPRPTVYFDTTDALSGIDYYKIKIGEDNFYNVAPEIVESDPYTLPPQAPGKRMLLVQAFDKAGNYAAAFEEFVIEPIEPPLILEWSPKIKSGEILTIKGKTYSDSQVIIWLQRGKEEPFSRMVKSNREGNFVFTAAEKLKGGTYYVWAEVTDNRGAKSYPTEKITIVVEQPEFLKIGSWTISPLAVTIPLVVFVILFVVLLRYVWYRFSLFKNELRKEVWETEQSLQKAFNLLREDIKNQIKILEEDKNKRRLTGKKEKIIKQLKKDLDDAEKFVRKEVEDIEKEVK